MSTFKVMMQEIKNSGRTERETVEISEELAEIIGSLTEARVSLGLTQRQLAEKSGLKQSAIARMESLQSVPRLDTMVKVARCLGVKIRVRPPDSKVVSFQVKRSVQVN
ncbi:MAG: helix-turn-helix transcriptional regulator [Oscillospiraceae bacterium]|nr:helix-turn-helix transcriptional regulator [Oscillospiraceae bacterium]